MRISDWSSDVCSSDLGRVKRKIAGEGAGKSGDGCRPAAGRISKRRRQKKKPRRRRDFTKASGPGLQAKEKAPEIPGPSVLLGRAASTTSAAAAEPAPNPRHVKTPLAHCLRRTVRSEEHTSELQSLMRISY